MTANEYQKYAQRTMNTDLTDHELLIDGVMGLCGESGECIDLIKKVEFQGHHLNMEKLAEELGDVAWYLAITAAAIGYDLDDILQMNVDKLRKRYPEGFDTDKSINRKE